MLGIADHVSRYADELKARTRKAFSESDQCTASAEDAKSYLDDPLFKAAAKAFLVMRCSLFGSDSDSCQGSVASLLVLLCKCLV